MKNSCRSCCYLESEETKENPLDDYDTKYNCLYRGVINSEVINPSNKTCEHWFSKEAKQRDEKINQILDIK
jgi:hypothetical protein